MNVEQLDIDLLRAINLDRITALDGIFVFITNSAPIIAGLIPLGFLLYGMFAKRKDIRTFGYVIAASYLLSAIISNVLKYAIARPRPFTVYPFIEKLSGGGSASFPSGHTSDAFSIAMAVSLLFPKRSVVIPMFLWAILVGYSRMDLGVHYPSDVLGGAIVGMGSAYCCWLVWKSMRKRQFQK